MKLEREYTARPEVSQKVVLFTDFVRKLPLDYDKIPGEFYYDNPVSILADATLSINRHYKNFVVPRVQLIRESGITSLKDLVELIDRVGIQNMSEFWNYKHPERVIILQQLAEKFLQHKEKYQLDSEMETLYEWGKESSVDGYQDFRVKGIGFTTFQYIRILCGADTVKPDVHIKRSVELAASKTRSLGEVVEIVEKTAMNVGVSARRLDYALWDYYSRNS